MQAKSNNAAAHCLQGDLYRQAGKPAQAIDGFQAGLKIDPNTVQTYELVANAQLARGQTVAAQKSQQTAAALWQKMLTTLPTGALHTLHARGDALTNAINYKNLIHQDLPRYNLNIPCSDYQRI